jgi:acyl carrier protein
VKTTTATLCEIIEGHLGCDPVKPVDIADADFIETLNLDSLDHVELLMAFEEEFSVSISDAEAEMFLPSATGKTKPLSELVALIDAKKMDQAA